MVSGSFLGQPLRDSRVYLPAQTISNPLFLLLWTRRLPPETAYRPVTSQQNAIVAVFREILPLIGRFALAP